MPRPRAAEKKQPGRNQSRNLKPNFLLPTLEKIYYDNRPQIDPNSKCLSCWTCRYVNFYVRLLIQESEVGCRHLLHIIVYDKYKHETSDVRPHCS